MIQFLAALLPSIFGTAAGTAAAAGTTAAAATPALANATMASGMSGPLGLGGAGVGASLGEAAMAAEPMLGYMGEGVVGGPLGQGAVADSIFGDFLQDLTPESISTYAQLYEQLKGEDYKLAPPRITVNPYQHKPMGGQSDKYDYLSALYGRK